MWFMGKQTVNRYDNFKSQIFGHKKDEYKQKYKNKKTASNLSSGHQPTNHPFLRKLILISTVSIGFYFANQKFKLLHQMSMYLDTLQLNPIIKITINALFSDVKRRFNTNPQKHTLNQKNNSLFANTYFLSQLNYFLKQLEIKNIPKLITQQRNSYVKFGPFRVDCHHKVLYINKEGNLVSQHYKSKIQIGNVNVFGRKTSEILQYQNTIHTFMKHINSNNEQQIKKSCQIINGINRIFLSNEQYEEIVEECVAKSSRKYEQINKIVNKYVQKQKEGKTSNRFFVKLS